MNKPYTVLLVDDDKFLLEMYKKKFDKYGISMEMCPSSTEALKKIREGRKYDILVFDVIMPEMDGLELLKTIHEEKLAPESIKIMLTNENSPEIIDSAKENDVAGYIVKATSIPSEVVEEIIKIADTKSK